MLRYTLQTLEDTSFRYHFNRFGGVASENRGHGGGTQEEENVDLYFMFCYNSSMINRGTCKVDDCDRPNAYRGRVAGIITYRTLCEKHRRPGRSSVNDRRWKGFVDNSKCERCGWDKAPCERHRKTSNRTYHRDNVIVLCPNCHKVEHLAT